MTELPPPSAPNTTGLKRKLMLAAAGVGVFSGLLLLVGIRKLGGPAMQAVTPLGALTIAAAPLFLGILSASFLREGAIRFGCGLLAICLVLAAPWTGEGAICILMYSPFALAITAVSALIVSRMRGSAILPWLLLPLPFAGLVWDQANPPRLDEATVTSSAIVDAPVEAVWASLDRLQMPFVAQLPWVVERLLPVPVEIRGGGTRPGDERRLVFANGVVLAKVVAAVPEERFEVALLVEQSGREFFDHWVSLRDSTFTLERLAGDRTRITHQTRYQPRLEPRWSWAPIEKHLSGLIQGYMLEAYGKQSFPSPEPLARRE